MKDLKKKSGLRCSIVSISRKLSGRQPLSDREIEALARALDVEVKVSRRTVTLGEAA